MSTAATPQPNATVNAVITKATAEISTYLPSVAQGIAGIQAAIANQAGMSHLQTGLNIATAALTAAASVPNPTVDEAAGFGLLITSIFSGIASLFTHNTVGVTTASTVAPVALAPQTVAPAVPVAEPQTASPVAEVPPVTPAATAPKAHETFAQESGGHKLETILTAALFHASAPAPIPAAQPLSAVNPVAKTAS